MINKVHAIRLLIIVSLALSLLISACGTVQTYPGSPLPRENVAIIKTEYTFYLVGGADTRIISVDDQDVNHNIGASMEVLPGRHKLEVQLWFAVGITEAPAATQVFMLDAKAGKSYRIVSNYLKKAIWIIEETTGRVVSGKKP